MQYYFFLQYRILRRGIEETGLPFFAAIALLGLLLVLSDHHGNSATRQPLFYFR